MRHHIKHRLTDEVVFTADIDCDEYEPESIKTGLAVEWAVRNVECLINTDLRHADLRWMDLRYANLTGADLRYAKMNGADLRGANLIEADLSHADLANTCLIDGGQRSDGHRFVGWVQNGILLTQGSIERTRELTNPGTDLGAETLAILDHIQAVARIRGLVPAE